MRADCGARVALTHPVGRPPPSLAQLLRVKAVIARPRRQAQPPKFGASRKTRRVLLFFLAVCPKGRPCAPAPQGGAGEGRSTDAGRASRERLPPPARGEARGSGRSPAQVRAWAAVRAPLPPRRASPLCAQPRVPGALRCGCVDPIPSPLTPPTCQQRAPELALARLGRGVGRGGVGRLLVALSARAASGAVGAVVFSGNSQKSSVCVVIGAHLEARERTGRARKV